MKKAMMIALAAAMVGSTASAGTLTQSAIITTANCMKTTPVSGDPPVSQLTNDVNVILSNAVQAAYVCNLTSPSTGLNPIWIGTCSTAGSTKTRTLQCVVTTSYQDSAGNTVDVFNDPDCTTAGAPLSGIGAQTFTANSAGGRVSAAFLGANATCGASAVETRITQFANQ